MNKSADELQRLNQMFAAKLAPHNAALGIEVVAAGDDWAELEMQANDDLTDSSRHYLHPGVVLSLVDVAATVAAHLATTKQGLVTLDLRVDYWSAARADESLRARSRCDHVRDGVVFVAGSVYGGHSGRRVAEATGAYLIKPPLLMHGNRGKSL